MVSKIYKRKTINVKEKILTAISYHECFVPDYLAVVKKIVLQIHSTVPYSCHVWQIIKITLKGLPEIWVGILTENQCYLWMNGQ